MNMIISNMITLIFITGAYLFLFVLGPFWLRGYKLTGENVIDRLVETFLFNHVVIISMVYILTLIGIYYQFTLIIFLIFIAIGYRFWFKRKQTYLMIDKMNAYFFHIKDGSYSIKVLAGDVLKSMNSWLISVLRKIKNPFGFICMLIIFGYGAYIRCYHPLVNMFFGSSDMYLHTEWTKYLIHNIPFYAGVYPLGFHAVVAFISSIFSINVVTVMRMLGSISGMLTIFSLFYILRRTMRSTFAISVALALYVVTDIFPFWATERQFLSLPQEYGTIFLYLAAYFLYKFMKDKEKRDLICFVSAVSLTLLIHFYVTLFAALICICIFTACITYLNSKTFIKLIIGVSCALLIAVLPLATGLIKGIEFNGSMDWALSFIFGTDNEEAEAEADALIDEVNDDKITLSMLLKSPSILNNMLKKDGFYKSSNDLSLFNINWFFPYLIATGISLIMPLFKFKGRRQWVFPAFSLYSLLLCLLFILSYYNIFSIMEYSRLYVFFIYSIPLVIGVPFELLHNLLCNTKRTAKIGYIAIISAVGVTATIYITVFNRFMPLGRIWQSQYNGAVLAYYDIVDNFPKNRWIIVSSMSEYSLCLFDGYHYEMIDFIMDMQDYNKHTKLYMNAEDDVFIFIVKRPNTYLDTDLQYLGAFKPLPEIDRADVYTDLSLEYGAMKGTGMIGIYQNFNANRVLQAKAYVWAEEYIKYFPKEMTCFYEDDEIIVYRIKQNPYALNNFAISYEGNINKEGD